MSIPVKVTDASVRECVLYANLHLRGEDTNQIGTPMTVEISDAFDRWLAEHDAKVRSEEREKCAELIQPTFTIDYITARNGELVQDPAMSANQALHRAATRIREQGS